MSYCRVGPDSDVYVYKSFDPNAERVCWALHISDGVMPIYWASPVTYYSRTALAWALLRLKRAGLKVPPHGVRRLLREAARVPFDPRSDTWGGGWLRNHDPREG